MTLDWARGVFTKFSIVLFVFLKLVSPDDAIENVIIEQNPWLEGLNVKEQDIKNMLNVFGEKCMLILDGLDEDAQGKNKNVLKIIRGQKFLDCNVLITSRPHKVGSIKKHFDAVVHIQGFTREQVHVFVSKMVTDKVQIDAILRFISNLKLEFTDEPVSDGDDNDEVDNDSDNNNNNGEVANDDDSTDEDVTDDDHHDEAHDDDSNEESDSHSHLYKNPILLSFLCILAQYRQIDFSKNTSFGEIYYRMIRCLYMKYIRRKEDLEFCPDSLVQVMKAIGKLAFQTLLSGKYLFRKSQVVEEVGPDAFDFGLLIGHEDAHRLISDETADIFVTFAHRSIQEFLGAFFFILSLNEGLTVEDLLGNHCREPIFLKNPLFFHFCAWLIYERGSCEIGTLNRAGDSLKNFIVKRMDLRQLDLEGITREYFAIDVEKAVRRSDEANLKLFADLVSQCKQLEHLIVPDDSAKFILRAVKQLPKTVVSVTLGDLQVCTPSGSIGDGELTLVVAECTSETLKEMKNVLMETENLGNTFRVFLLDFSCRGKNINITDLLGKKVKELHIAISKAGLLHFQGQIDSCQLLTHLSLFRLTPKAQPALINALGVLRHLRHLTIGQTNLSDGKLIHVLPSCSKLTHLSLVYTNVSGKDLKLLQSLSQQLTSLCMTMDNFIGESSCIGDFLRGPWQSLNTFSLIGISSDFYEQYNIPFSMRQVKKTPDAKVNRISSMIDQRAMPALASLSLIRSVHSITDLSQKVAAWNLCKLDISHNSCVTGNLSCLLQLSVPSLSSLILHDCGLNSQDLKSLAVANIESRLPELKHLDVSENQESDFRDLFAHDSKWVRLSTLSISITGCKCGEWLAEKVESGYLARVQQIRLWIFCTCNMSAVDVIWKHLERREVFLLQYNCNAQSIMASVANARTKGRLPVLRTMSLMIDCPGQIIECGIDTHEDRLRKCKVDVHTGRIVEHMFLARIGIL